MLISGIPEGGGLRSSRGIVIKVIARYGFSLGKLVLELMPFLICVIKDREPRS